MRTLTLLIALLWALPTLADTDRRVATVTPITHSLATALLADTPVQVDYLPPKRLPVNRIPSWLHKTQTQKYPRYDALVAISAARPDLAYALTLRQTNIRLVTIDIAYALLPKGERVVMTDPKEYFWLNANNLALMLGILKRDLGLLWPDLRTDINQNYQRISQTVRQTNLAMEAILQQHDIAAFSTKTSALHPLAASLSTDIMPLTEANDIGLAAILVGRKPSAQQDTTITTPFWKIDDFARFSEQSFVQRLEGNLGSLKGALGE